MTEPMTDARLAQIEDEIAQYGAKRSAAHLALIDHDRNEVLRQEAYASSLAQTFAEEAVPELLAEARRARAAEWQLAQIVDRLRGRECRDCPARERDNALGDLRSLAMDLERLTEHVQGLLAAKEA